MSLSSIIGLGTQTMGTSGGSGILGSSTPDPVISIVTPVSTNTQTIDYTWFIDKGSFFDRFGVAKIPVLMCTDPTVQAMLKDISNRWWVDLRDPNIATALSFMVGVATPGIGTITSPITGMTSELASTILSTRPTIFEQYGVVKLFFS